MKRNEFAARVAEVRAKASSSESLVEALLLVAEVVNERNLARSTEDDVELAGEETRLQHETYGADAFDPDMPHEDLNATLTEDSPIDRPAGRQPNPHE